MRKTFTLFILVLATSSVFAIYQMRNWTLPPNKVFMQWGNTPTVTSIQGAPNSIYGVANGVYDENNNLLFYVKDATLYDSESNIVSSVTFGDILKEIVIVPIPGQCRKYYVISGAPMPMSSSRIFAATVDCSSGIPLVTSGPTQIATINDGGNIIGLAASKIVSGSGSAAIRYLYAITRAGFHRLTISSSGFSSLTTLAPLPLGIGEATEVELKHDGSKVAWGDVDDANGKVYEISTTSPYNLTTYILPAQASGFCPNEDHRISGIEYDFSGNLWVSATSTCTGNRGLYKITTTTPPSYIYLSNTGSYDKTQLELTIYNYIIAVHTNGSLGYINPDNNTFSTNALNIPITLKSNGNSFFTNVYSLPDQIDYEDYSYFNGIAQGVADFKINNVSPSSNCGAIQTVFNCNPIQLTNLSTGAISYVLEVQSVDANCNIINGLNYHSGRITTLPTDLRNMPGTNGNWLANNTGRFRVRLTANNGCTTTSKFTYIQVNGTPTAVTSCYRFVNNTTCSGTGVVGGANCASVVSVCQNNPKIKADCSGGQFVQGSFDLVIDEFNTSCGFIQNVANSLNNPLSSTADLVCLSLNDFTTTPGYFFSNTPDLRYRVRLTIRNVCSQNTTESWFIDNFGGCKADGEELESMEAEDKSNLDDYKVFAYVFPNPVSGNATIEIQTNIGNVSTIQFIDIQGKIVYQLSESERLDDGIKSFEVPTQNWAEGIYFYNIAVGDKKFKGKIIKTQ